MDEKVAEACPVMGTIFLVIRYKLLGAYNEERVKQTILMIYISYNFSSARFNLVGVVRRCFSWSSVSDDLLFSSCSFLVLFLALSFSRLILSLSFLCSSVPEALFLL